MQRRLLISLEFALIVSLSLVASAQTAQETTLYTFTGGADGSLPQAGLAFGPNGSLYGATNFGGMVNSFCPSGCGTAFQLTPGSGGTWTFETIHSFAGGTGDYGHSMARAAFDTAGNLWGTAFEWGPGGFGGVFELSAADNWNESLVYSFSNGEQPTAGLTAREGSWYGTTQYGPGFVNNGTVFSLTPGANGQWNENVLHAFAAGADGFEPQTELVFDKLGNVYGSTPYGGPNGSGDIFELTPVSGGHWKEQVIYNFPLFTLGGSYYPSTLIFDAHGNLYGTTAYGGATNCDVGLGCGIVFELKRVGNTWQEITLYEFAGGTDGQVPRAGLLSDGHGNLYGTTQYGGTGSCPTGQFQPGCGTVFKLNKSSGSWQKTTIYNFTNGADGAFPNGTLVSDSAGNLYGVTVGASGSTSAGTVFEIQP
jgi:hypothetical protein